MRGKRKYQVAAIIVSILALLATWFVFDMRYMWFVQGREYIFLRVGFLVGVGLIMLGWVFRPSRMFVGLIGMATLCFPPVLGGGRFVALNAT